MDNYLKIKYYIFISYHISDREGGKRVCKNGAIGFLQKFAQWRLRLMDNYFAKKIT